MKDFKLLFFCVILIITSTGIVMASEFKVPIERRQLSKSFMPPAGKNVKIAFLDADSTLRVAPSGAPSANAVDDVALLPMTAQPLKRLADEGYLLAVVSNQAGIQYGHVTFEIAQAAMVTTLKRLADRGVRIHYFDFSEKKDVNRKPDIGMGVRLAELIEKKFKCSVDWQNSIMIGDSAWKKGVDTEPDGTPGSDHSNSDRLFAENLAKKFGKVTFHHPRDFFGWMKFGVRNFPDYKTLNKFLETHPEVKP